MVATLRNTMKTKEKSTSESRIPPFDESQHRQSKYLQASRNFT